MVLPARLPSASSSGKTSPITTPTMADTTNPVIITDLGDSVRFLWNTPFGTQSGSAKSRS